MQRSINIFLMAIKKKKHFKTKQQEREKVKIKNNNYNKIKQNTKVTIFQSKFPGTGE